MANEENKVPVENQVFNVVISDKTGKTLATKDTYLDKNIKVSAQAGSISIDHDDVVVTKGDSYLVATGGREVGLECTYEVKVDTNGFIDQTDAKSAKETSTLRIKEGSVAGGEATITSNGDVLSTTETDYAISLSATGNATVTEGYVDAATPTVAGTDTIYVKAGSSSGSDAAAVSATGTVLSENTTKYKVDLASSGNATVTEGYQPAATPAVTGTGSAYIKEGSVSGATDVEVVEGTAYFAETGKSVVVMATGTVTATEGYIDAGTTAATGKPLNLKIKEGAITEVDNAVTTTSDDIALSDTAIAGGYAIDVAASAAVNVTTSGWIDEADHVKEGSDKKYVAAFSAANSAEAGKTYTEISGAGYVVPTGGYLYLNAGYLKDNQKISLANLIPDEATVTVKGSNNLIYKSEKAYDKDGNLITGSMDKAAISDITVSNLDAKINSVTFEYDADDNNFDISGNGAISGDTSVSVSKGFAGNIDIAEDGTITTTALDAKTGSISGTAALNNVTVATIAGSTTVTGEKTAPVLSLTTTEAIKTTASSSTIPESGHYVTVNLAANNDKYTVTPVVTTPGYGTADHNDLTGAEVDASYAAQNLYVTVKDGSVNTVIGDITKDASSTAKTSETGTHSVKVSLGGVVAVTEGYVETNNTDVSKSLELKIQDGSVATTDKADATAEITPVVGFVYTAAGVKDTKEDGKAYIEIKANTAATTGTISGHANTVVTEGYVDADNFDTEVTGTATVKAAADKSVYIRVYDGELV